MNTQGKFEQDTPFTDGRIVLAAADFTLIPGGGTGPIARNAKGDISLNIVASQTDVFICDLSKLMHRTGILPFLQEQFGTAAGVAGPTAVANTSSPDAQVGVPPFTGTTGLTPQTGFIAKGIKFTDITLKFLIGTNPLSLHTIGLSKTVFPVPGTPAALVITDILANAANGLPTAANANPQTTKVAITGPVFNVSDLSNLIIELDVTTPAGGTYRLYGADVHFQYNYN